MNLENFTLKELEGLKEQIKEEMLFREEEHARLLRDYESDNIVCEGWVQQDLIDMYRHER